MCENKMYINITAEDYFNELKLMQQQYGQEEDLYPWIYMLLQMAECKKKEKAEKMGEHYNPVSIRDVHNAKVLSKDNRDDKYWEKRWELTKRVGAPDIAIFSMDEKSIIGCVEVKGLGDTLFSPKSQLNNLSIGLPSLETYILGYDGRGKGNIPVYISQDQKYIENYKTPEEITIEIDKLNRNFIIKKTTTKDIEEIVKDILCKGSGKLLTLIGENNGWEYGTENLPAGKESNQLAGHLDKFKKVLYTNGLDFYYLKLLEGNRVNVKWKVHLCTYKVLKESAEKKIEMPDDFEENFKALINNLSQETKWYE